MVMKYDSRQAAARDQVIRRCLSMKKAFIVLPMVIVLVGGCGFPDFPKIKPAAETENTTALSYAVNGMGDAAGLVSLSADTSVGSAAVVLEGMKALLPHPVDIYRPGLTCRVSLSRVVSLRLG
jgi:hypothetical protein